MMKVIIENRINPDNVIIEIEGFLYGDFRKWCEQVSMKELWRWDKETLMDMDDSDMAIIRTNYLNFKEMVHQLSSFVENQIERHNEQEQEVIWSELFALKHRIDALTSKSSIHDVLEMINREADQYYTGKEEDTVLEHSGEVVKRKIFSKQVAYAYPENYFVYEEYFSLVVGRLSVFLDTCYEKQTQKGNMAEILQTLRQMKPDFKTDLRAMLSEMVVKGAFTDSNEEGPITENGSIQDLRKKQTLPLSLRIYNNDKVIPKIGKCFDTLSKNGTFIIDTERAVFVNIFSNEPVVKKAVWNRSNIELVYFINSISGLLKSEDYKWDKCLSCFERYDGKKLEIQSFKDANTENLNKIARMRITERDEIEKLDKAIKRFIEE